MAEASYLAELFGLTNKVAIITGGTGGLGTGMAVALAKSGASIVSIEMPNDPNSKQLHDAIESATGKKVTTFTCDVHDASSLRGCFTDIWAQGISPDILVNCAGVIRRNRIEDATDDEFDLIFGVNVRATFIASQEFGRKLVELGQPGKIINISSGAAFQAGNNMSVYASSKGAVLQMTKAFSNEWAGKGIQVNGIAPGYMRTPMTEAYATNEVYMKNLMARVPAQRWGLPEDMAGAVVYLASQASNFMTGTTLIVDGGLVGK